MMLGKIAVILFLAIPFVLIVIVCWEDLLLPYPPASMSRPEGQRGDERTGDERSEGGL